jgi:hypothetical protein
MKTTPSSRQRLAKHLAVLAGTWLVAGCVLTPDNRSDVSAEPLQLKHLGTLTVPRGSDAITANFGGISGMDWDPISGTWYLLSDDRSERAAARFYKAKIDLGLAGIQSVKVTGVVDLLQPEGEHFVSARRNGRPPDPEALRLDPQTGELVWSSETDRRLSIDSFVRQARLDGSFVKEWPLPPMLRSSFTAESGARNNLSLEGLAFTADGAALWLGMEAPIYEDGPVANLQSGAMVRFTKIRRDGQLWAQYAYPIERIPVAPTGGKLRADNGVSEILALPNDKLLVVERAGHEVDELVFKFSVRLYEASTAGASDVSQWPSLAKGEFRPMNKRLLVDLNALGIGEVDNIEAAAWGPCLARHKASLLLASDDNFSPRQVNQFLLFEVTGGLAAQWCQ